MSEFSNVTVKKAANIYYDGKVTSRVVTFADGSTKTLGIMMPGDYEFGTEKKELMEILSGEVSVLLPGSEEWELLRRGGPLRCLLIRSLGLRSARLPIIVARILIKDAGRRFFYSGGLSCGFSDPF
ncbi:pyrimidine/purine nucleoside phosphorylase [Desulfobulbus sp. US1]|nr:pyrimidine/purine nucleoside phosphorylase [Desulfobulbus sp. US1]